jgi:hypothetical protein
LSVYRCENLICASRGREVLLRGIAGDLGSAGPFAIAFPCPSCSGAWEQRWALTYVRQATNASLAGGVVVDYRLAPTQRRRTPIASQLSIVIGMPQARPWGEWSSPNIQQVPAGMKRFLRAKRPAALRSALREQPRLAGALLAGLTAPATLRAFVTSLRGLPPEQKLGGIAMGLAHAFHPRRTDVYAMAPGEVQTSHYHYIAYDPENFTAKLMAYGALDAPGRFLDVGSGSARRCSWPTRWGVSAAVTVSSTIRGWRRWPSSCSTAWRRTRRTRCRWCAATRWRSSSTATTTWSTCTGRSATAR